MIIDRTKLIGNIFEHLNLEDENYYNVVLRDEIFNDYEHVYLGKLINTYRVKNNSTITLPKVERKVIKATTFAMYDKYYIFDKWIDEEMNDFISDNLINTNKTITAKYKYIYVPKVANIQEINGVQNMMNTFIVKSSFPIYVRSYYFVEDYLIKTNVITNYNELTREYETEIKFVIEELEEFEGNSLSINDNIYLFKEPSKINLYDDLIITLNMNIYRSDASTGD